MVGETKIFVIYSVVDNTFTGGCLNYELCPYKKDNHKI